MKKIAENLTYYAVRGVTRLYMIAALAVSFSHVIDASHKLGLYGWQAFTVPFAIDGLALLGMIGRSSRFAESTQRTGFKLQIGAGLVSLTANVYSGETSGERLYGILIVALFVIVEWYAGQLKPAAVDVAARRSAAATKAAATRKANAATKTAAPKTRARKTPAAKTKTPAAKTPATKVVKAPAPTQPATRPTLTLVTA